MSEPQQIINVGQVANDGTGESLRDAFNAVNNNFANVWAAGPVNSQVVISNNRVSTNETNLDLILAGNGVGNVTVASTTVPSLDAVYDLGRANRRFDEVHAVYYYGNGAYLTGINANGTGGGNVYFSQGAPGNASIGDIWIESDTGVQYLYFNDDTSNQWAEMEAYQSFSTGSGSANTGNWAFSGNNFYNINGGSINNSDLSHGSTAFLNLPDNGNTTPITLLNYYGNVAIAAATSPGNTQTWTFSNNGNLIFPDNSGSSWPINQQRFGMGNIGAWLDGQWTIGEFSGNGVSGTVGIRIDPSIEGNTGITLPSQADSVTQRVSIYNTGGGGIELYTGANNWTFNANGNLTVPGNITGAKIIVTTPTALANLNAVAGGRAFVNNANLVAVGNFGNQVGGGGSNTVPVWSDGTNWYIG